MKPRALMIMGAAVGLVLLLASYFSEFSVALFMAGALFGKGYGVWEVKSQSKIEKLENPL